MVGMPNPHEQRDSYHLPVEVKMALFIFIMTLGVLVLSAFIPRLEPLAGMMQYLLPTMLGFILGRMG